MDEPGSYTHYTQCAEGGWEVLLVARIKDGGGSWVESGSCRGGVSIIKETPRGFLLLLSWLPRSFLC